MTASLRSKAQNQNPKSQRNKGDAASSDGIVQQPSRQPLPMKRHKGLFIALMGVFVAWVGVMLGLYFTTVRPREHSAPPPSARPQPPATSRALAAQASSLQ